MSVFALLASWVLTTAPHPALGPRPMVLPTPHWPSKQVLFVRENWHGDSLWLKDLTTGDERLQWRADPAVIDHIRWLDDRRVLLMTRAPASAPALWRLNLQDNKPRQLTPAHWPEGKRRGAELVHADERQALVSLDRRQPYLRDLYRLTAHAAQPLVAEVNNGDVLRWMVGPRGMPRMRQRFRVKPHSIEYVWEWRSEPYSAWTRLDAWQLSEPAWRPLSLSADASHLWVYAETAQRDTYGLHRLRMLDAGLSAPAVASAAADMARVWWSKDDRQQPALVEWHGLLPGQRALRKSWRQWLERLHELRPDSHMLIRHVDQEEKNLLVAEVNGRDPQQWWWYQTDNNQLTALGQEWPAARALPHLLRPLRWTSRDGLPLTAYYAAPRGGARVDAPLFVQVHGGPWARDHYAYDPFTALLTQHGIGVLKVNFRGSSGVGRGFLMASRGEWGQAMQADVMEGIEQMTRRRWAAADKVCIGGMSYGGYAALQAVLTEPARFRCALAHAAVTDLAAHIQDIDNRGDQLGAAEWRAMLSQPQESTVKSLDLQTVSPLFQAASLTRPVLLSHSRNDGIVSPLQSEAFRRQAPALWLTALPINGGHHLQRASERLQLYGPWLRFLTRYLVASE